MARKKIAKRVKPLTLVQEVQVLKHSANLIGQELATLRPALRSEVTAYSNTLQRYLERIEARLTERPIEDDERTINQAQLDQLYAGVNKIAAYAAAMDETKKTMIKLTRRRIDKLDARVTKLRVRLNDLDEQFAAGIDPAGFREDAQDAGVHDLLGRHRTLREEVCQHARFVIDQELKLCQARRVGREVPDLRARVIERCKLSGCETASGDGGGEAERGGPVVAAKED